MKNRKQMVPVRHRACGNVVMYFVRRLERGDKFTADNVRKLDGSAPVSGESLGECHFCGEKLTFTALEQGLLVD